MNVLYSVCAWLVDDRVVFSVYMPVDDRAVFSVCMVVDACCIQCSMTCR